MPPNMESSKIVSEKELEGFQIPLDEIRWGTDHFDEDNIIGQGGFGKVYKGKLARYRRVTEVAVKRLDPESNQGKREFLTEISILCSYRHDNVVSLVGYCTDDGEMLLVYEYASHGSLDQYLRNTNTMFTLTWPKRLKICLDAARGLHYLHTGVGSHHRIIHRDVKSSNILLYDNWEAKIADFGLSKVGPANQPYSYLVSNFAGTLGYGDPQYIETGKLTKESDVYSFGVVLFEMLSGRLVLVQEYYGDNERFSLIKMVRRCNEGGDREKIIDYKIRKQIEPDCLEKFYELADSCLHKQQERRPTMALIVTELVLALKLQDRMEGPSTALFNYHRISLEEIKSATHNFNEQLSIRQGRFGKVYKGKLSDSMVVAVKRCNPKSKQVKHMFQTQIENLFSCRHKNLATLIGFCNDGGEMILVYEHGAQGCIDDHILSIDNNNPLTWAQRLKICIGAAKGLDYLHSGGGPECMIIHGDLKSTSIILDENWEAKVSDYGLSTVGQVHQPFKHAISNFGNCDPYYIRTGLHTTESDVYSFGLILFQVLCEKPALDDDYGNQERYLAKWVNRCTEEESLKDTISKNLEGDMHPSVSAMLTRVGCECLKIRRIDRPEMMYVVKQLEHALEVHENPELQELQEDEGITNSEKEDEVVNDSKKENEVTSISESDLEADEDWEQKLPAYYQQLMKGKASSVVYNSKKELYSILKEGILVNWGKMWFSLSKVNGKTCQLISATDFIGEDNPCVLYWTSKADSRFSTVPEFIDASQINIEVEIHAEMLSPRTTYAAYLVYRRRHEIDKYSSTKNACLVCNHKEAEDDSSMSMFAFLREDGWLEIELWHFLNHEKYIQFDVQLQGIPNAKYGIIIEGIEFRPLGYSSATTEFEGKETEENDMASHVVSDSDLSIDWKQKLPSDYLEIIGRSDSPVDYNTERELYLHLSSGILIDDRRKLFSLQKQSGKKCLMLSPRELSTRIPVNWIPSPESRFLEIAQIPGEISFSFRCEIRAAQMLSPETAYAVYLVYGLAEKHSVFPLNAMVKRCGQRPKFRTIYLKFQSPFIKTRNDRKYQIQMDRPYIPGLPRPRRTGAWMEVELGSFFNGLEDDSDVVVDLEFKYCTFYLFGLSIVGIEFRPS